MDRLINGWFIDGRSVDHLTSRLVDHFLNLSAFQLVNLSVNQSMYFNCPSFSPNTHDSFLRVLYWGVYIKICWTI